MSSVECFLAVSNLIMDFLNIPNLANLFPSEYVPAHFGKLRSRINWTPVVISVSAQALRYWRGRSIKVDNLRSHDVVYSIDTNHPLRSYFMDSYL